jgi:ABC-type nitrate/sulfonate/bicarbonate transport system substrate-binding protein
MATRTAVIALAILWLSAGGAAAAKLVVGYSGISAELSHLWIAKEAGKFKKYGVDVEPVYFSGGTRLMQALLTNDIQLGITSGISAARAVVAGADVTIVAGHMNKLTYTLYSAKEITKPEQLRGKALAISGFGTTSHASTVLALRKFGLHPTKDVTLMQIGDQSSRFAALQANTIQGVLIAPPLTLLAKQRGFNALLDMTQSAIPWSQELVLANAAAVKTNPELTRDFLKGFIDGLSLWHTDKAMTVELLARFMKLDLKKDREALDEAYEFMRRGTEKKPYPSFEGLQVQLDMIGETDGRAKYTRPQQLVNLKIIEALDKSGFIDGLYSGSPRPRSAAISAQFELAQKARPGS